MKPNLSLYILSISALALIFTYCQKPTRDNPWDDLASLDPESWAPGNLKVETPSITQRTISWDYSFVGKIEGFVIDKKRGNDNWISHYLVLSDSERKFIDTILINPAINYEYRMYAFAGENKSGLAQITFGSAIPAPTELTYTYNSPISITLHWDYPTTGHESFQLERKTNQDAWAVIASNINPSMLSFTDSLINLDQRYYSYRLRAYANSYFSDYSPEVKVFGQSVTNPVTGKVWMDRNLGASRVAISFDDLQAFGDLYQWGRKTDGHQERTSGTTADLSDSDTPSHGQFILALNSPYDWRSPQNNALWQGINGINNPCPEGYRLPTRTEWEAELQTWISNNAAGAYNSSLKLTLAGHRGNSFGTISNVGTLGIYWSSTIDGNKALGLSFYSENAIIDSGDRAFGISVRCLKD